MLKYKPCYDLHSKMSWQSDFKKFYQQLVSVITQRKYSKLRISDSKNEAKQNQYEFPSANSIIKCLKDFETMTDIFCPFFSESLHIHFNPPQNVYSMLLLNGLLMVTN